MIRISSAAFITLLLAGTMVVAQAQKEPSLGEIARQKPAVKAKRVVTNEEIPPSPEADKPAAAKSESTGANGPKAADPQARLQELTKNNQELQKILDQVQLKIAGTQDAAVIKTLVDTIEHVKKLMEQNDAEIAKLKAAGVTPPAENTSTEPAPAAPATTSTATTNK